MPPFFAILREEFFFISLARNSFPCSNLSTYYYMCFFFSRLQCGTCKVYYAYKEHANFAFEHL